MSEHEPLAANPQPSADDWKRAGDLCLDREDYDGALEAYFQALQLEPDHPAARYNLALVHLEKGEYPEAIALLQGVLTSRPGDIEAQTTLGWAQLWTGDAESAVKSFRRALFGNPNFAPAHVGLGWAHMAEEPPAIGRSADAFARAIALETDDSEAYYGLATVCELQGEPARAVPLLEDVLRLWPGDMRAHESLARVLEGLGRWEEAAHHLMQLSHFDRENDKILRHLAELFASHHAHERAAVFWRKLLKLRPADAAVARKLGDSLMEAQHPAEAVEAYTEAIALEPDDASLYAALGHAYFEARRYAEAVDAYTQAYKREPEAAAHYYNLGNAYLEGGQAENATWAYQKAARLAPELVEARVALGWAMLAQERFEAAREEFDAVLKGDPDNVGALDGLGSSYWREGVPDLAVDALERAASLEPETAGLRFKLGMIYEETGRYEDARRAFRSLVGTFADERVGDALARLERHLGS